MAKRWLMAGMILVLLGTLAAATMALRGQQDLAIKLRHDFDADELLVDREYVLELYVENRTRDLAEIHAVVFS